MIEYATDTYQVFNFSGDEVFQQFAMSGRFITAIIGYLVKMLNLSENAIYWGSSILAIIFVLLSIYKLYKIIRKDVKNKILRILIPILIVINPFSIELFLYIEKGIMIFGILMSIYAVDNLIKYFETSKKRNIIYSMIFMFFANCSYQGVVGIFVAIAIVYVLKYSKSIKEFFKNNIIIAVIYGVAAVIDYILVKIIYSSGRVSGEIVFAQSVEKIIQETGDMIKTTYSLLPHWAFVLVVCFVLMILICQAVSHKYIRRSGDKQSRKRGKYAKNARSAYKKYIFRNIKNFIYNFRNDCNSCNSSNYPTNKFNLVCGEKYLSFCFAIWNSGIVFMYEL